MKYLQKYGRPGNSTTYRSDTVMPYITKHKRQMDKGMLSPFHWEGWPRNSQELPRYNPNIHSGQDLQCSTTQLHRIENWEDTSEEPKWLSVKSIHDITNFDYPSNFRRCSIKMPRDNNIICRFLQGIWLHTKREDGANTSRLRPPQRNRRRHNDAI